MYLAGRNDKVDAINTLMLQRLEGEMKAFKANIRGAMRETAYPTDAILHLKVGAQVMFTVNDSAERRVNGTL
jgi:hypothetical protein